MSDENALATLGRKQLQLEAQDQAYTKLLHLLAAVVSGAVDTSRIMVNMTERTWIVAEPGQRPGTPPTINGLPVCIVAPDQSEAAGAAG